MSRALERRLVKLESVLAPPPPPRFMPLVAYDDPNLERVLAEHGRPDVPYPTVILLAPAKPKRSTP